MFRELAWTEATRALNESGNFPDPWNCIRERFLKAELKREATEDPDRPARSVYEDRAREVPMVGGPEPLAPELTDAGDRGTCCAVVDSQYVTHYAYSTSGVACTDAQRRIISDLRTTPI